MKIKNFDQFVNEDEKKVFKYPGEKAADTKGLDVMTDEQAAFCFVMAKDWMDKIFLLDDSGKKTNTTFIHNHPVETWAAWTQIKQASLDRKVGKFSFLLGKEAKSVYDITNDQKTRDQFKMFSDMDANQLIKMATAALVEEPNEAAIKKYKNVKIKFEKKDSDNAGNAIKQNMNLPNIKGKRDAEKLAIEKYANSHKLEIELVTAMWDKYNNDVKFK